MTNQGKLRGTEATRAELLDIGLELVLERGLPVGLNIRVAEVVDRAGRSLGSAYQIWDNQEHFREDVALHLARSASRTSAQLIMPEFMAAIEREDTIHEMARSIGATFFASVTGAPNFFVSRHFWTVAPPLRAEIHDALALTAYEVQKDFNEFFTMVLDHFKLRPSHGYELLDLTRMLIAMAEGFALQSRFPTPPESGDTYANLFVDCLVLFIDRCTEPIPS